VSNHYDYNNGHDHDREDPGEQCESVVGAVDHLKSAHTDDKICAVVKCASFGAIPEWGLQVG
jgi:hypothetical protein